MLEFICFILVIIAIFVKWLRVVLEFIILASLVLKCISEFRDYGETPATLLPGILFYLIPAIIMAGLIVWELF